MILVVASDTTELQQFTPDDDITTLAVGVGKIQAAVNTAKAIATYRPQAVIGVGICRAINENFDLNDILIANRIVQYDMDLVRFGIPVGHTFDGEGHVIGEMIPRLQSCDNETQYYVATIGTADVFATTREVASMASRLQELHIDAVDMESYAIVAAAHAFNVPCGIIRCVSDTSKGHRPKKFASFMKQASFGLYEATRCVIRHSVPNEKSPIIL